MRGFPNELFIVLIFGAVLLVQFVYRQVRRKAESMRAEAEPGARPAPLPSTDRRPRAVPDGDFADEADEAEPPPAVGAPRAAVQTMPAPVEPRAPARARRFSRAALMADRQAVQDAIVIAAILRPCHAHRPYDVD